MNARPLVPGIVALAVVLAGSAGSTIAAETKSTAAAAQQADPMTEAMIKAGTPGAEHKVLKKLEGTFKVTVKSWMGPGEPEVSAGTSQNKLMLGGRYLKQNYKGTFMGQPFEGIGFMGYDNAKKVWWGTWMDSMSTGVFLSEGTADSTGKTFNYKATMTNPMDGSAMPIRDVMKLVDNDTYVFQMFENREGKEVMSMEMTYKRVKK